MNDAADEPGFGRYELLAKIGEGPRGSVYVARTIDAPSAELYAVEVCVPPPGEDAAQTNLAQAVERATIHHRNVIRIVELVAGGAGQLVVSEHHDDCTLAELEERHRNNRPPRVVVAAIIDALHGLHAAHTRIIDGVAHPAIHGSLSPDSLQVGLDGVTRLAGFGAAPPIAGSRRSRDAAGYLAPEQLTGDTIDQRSDVFALGVTLWNALTGKRLFHGRTDRITTSNVLERQVPRPSKIGLAPPEAFDAVVLQALQRDPARRYQTAAEMARALTEVAQAIDSLGTADDVAAWVVAAFANKLTARRATIMDLMTRRPAPNAGLGSLASLPLLPALEGSFTREPSVRDELSPDELSLATGGMPRVGSSAPRTSSAARKTGSVSHVTGPMPRAATSLPVPTASASAAPAAARSRRQELVVLAVAAFAVVAFALGWRHWQSREVASGDPALSVRTAPAPTEIHVTVLQVHGVLRDPPPVLATATAAPATAAQTGDSAAAAAPETVSRRASPSVPSYPVVRGKKPVLRSAPVRAADASARPADSQGKATDGHADSSARPTETAGKSETLEANPYR